MEIPEGKHKMTIEEETEVLSSQERAWAHARETGEGQWEEERETPKQISCCQCRA